MRKGIFIMFCVLCMCVGNCNAVYASGTGDDWELPIIPEGNEVIVQKVDSFTCSNVAVSSLQLNWNRVSNADGYNVEQLKDGSWVQIADLKDCNTTSYKVESLSAGTNYQFRIRVYEVCNGKTLYSDYVETNATTLTLPSKTKNVNIAGRTENSIQIGWNRNKIANGYAVYQSINGKWVKIAKIKKNTITTYTVNNLEAGTKYDFAIKSYKNEGEIVLYSGATKISATTLPSKITKFVITSRTVNSLQLSWSKSNSAKGYVIDQLSADGKKWNRIANIKKNKTVSFTVGNLSAGNTFKFRIRPYIKEADGKAFYGASVKISGTTLPENNTKVKISGRTVNSLKINWRRNDSADGYVIQQLKDGKWQQIAKIKDKTVTSQKIKNLSPGTQYKFRIVSFKYEGKKALYSGYVKVNGTTKPLNNADVKIGARSKNALMINWSKNDSAAGYVVEVYRDGKWQRKVIKDNAVTSYKVKQLLPGQKYKFRIRSYQYENNIPVYSDYVYITGKTLSK